MTIAKKNVVILNQNKAENPTYRSMYLYYNFSQNYSICAGFFFAFFVNNYEDQFIMSDCII